MPIIRFIALLGLYFFSSTSVLFAGTCSIVSGTSETISTDCTALEIEGDGSNVTVAENTMLYLKGFHKNGGERGIRTLGTVLPHTRFPSERLKPLSHLSDIDPIYYLEAQPLTQYPWRGLQAR